MPHHTPLIATIVAGLVLAFIFGAIANRLRLSPLAGYLLAGVAVGPHTPGFVADQSLAAELAEIGVILLMFGVGLHFSLKDLLSVRATAVPGAIAQIALSTLLVGCPDDGLAARQWLCLRPGAVAILSSYCALQERHLLDSERGRIAVGWPSCRTRHGVGPGARRPSGLLAKARRRRANLPGASEVATTLAITLGKVGAFVALMLVVGRRVIPWALHYVAHTGSRELFRLAVLAIALGVAYGAATLFDVSFALGAFFAGMVLSESELSQQAAAESLPLRDAFAVLFFVSVGMLFDPSIVLRDPWPVFATLVIILVGNSGAGLLIPWLRPSAGDRATISAGPPRSASSLHPCQPRRRSGGAAGSRPRSDPPARSSRSRQPGVLRGHRSMAVARNTACGQGRTAPRSASSRRRWPTMRSRRVRPSVAASAMRCARRGTRCWSSRRRHLGRGTAGSK
jgi:CPA2 family monovalent cation:H+ antiporter-2